MDRGPWTRSRPPHGPGPDHPMDLVHGPPLIFKRKPSLLIWKFTSGQGMRNTDSYFRINIPWIMKPWLPICIRRVNFGHKINRPILCTIEYYERGGGGGDLPDWIAIWKCWNENIEGRNALDLQFVVFPVMGAPSQSNPLLWDKPSRT